MKVLQTIPSFLPVITGPANIAAWLARELEARGIGSPIWTSDRGAEIQNPESKIENSVRRFREGPGFMQYRTLRGFWRALMREELDVVHAHTYRAWTTDAALAVSRLRGRPLVLHGHGTLLGYEALLGSEGVKLPYRLYDRLTRRASALHADAFVATTRAEADDAVRFGLPRGKVHLIPVAAESTEFESVLKEPRESPTLLFAGRIARDRNLEQVVDAMPAIQESIPGARLRIAGIEAYRSLTDAPGYLAAIKERVDSLDLRGAVEFRVGISRREMVEEYRKADLFVYTSRYENLGLTLLEAATSGLPLLTTPVGIAPELIEEGRTGSLVEIGDSAGLARRAVELLSDRARCRRMGTELAVRVRERYSPDLVMKKYLDLYREVV